MSSAATASTVPRPIRSARSLFEALRAPDFFARFAALRAIQKEPAVALSFGIFEGQDVIDALIRESHRGAGTAEWMQWLGTLDCFEDPRTRDFFFAFSVTVMNRLCSLRQRGIWHAHRFRHFLKAFTISF